LHKLSLKKETTKETVRGGGWEKRPQCKLFQEGRRETGSREENQTMQSPDVWFQTRGL